MKSKKVVKASKVVKAAKGNILDIKKKAYISRLSKAKERSYKREKAIRKSICNILGHISTILGGFSNVKVK